MQLRLIFLFWIISIVNFLNWRTLVATVVGHKLWDFIKDNHSTKLCFPSWIGLVRVKIFILHLLSCFWTVKAAFAPPAQMWSCPSTLKLAESRRRVKTVWNPSAYPLYPFQNMFHFCMFLVILKSNSSLAPLERQIQWETQLSFKAGDLVRHSDELNSIYSACNLAIIFLPLFISFLYDVKKNVHDT